MYDFPSASNLNPIWLYDVMLFNESKRLPFVHFMFWQHHKFRLKVLWFVKYWYLKTRHKACLCRSMDSRFYQSFPDEKWRFCPLKHLLSPIVPPCFSKYEQQQEAFFRKTDILKSNLIDLRTYQLTKPSV